MLKLEPVPGLGLVGYHPHQPMPRTANNNAMHGLIGAGPKDWLFSALGHAALFIALMWSLSREPLSAPDASLSLIIDNPILAPAKPARAREQPHTKRLRAPKLVQESLPDSQSLPVPKPTGPSNASPSSPVGIEGDGDGAPTATAEFMVTSMPELDSEVRIPYPASARSRRVQGPVVMDLLIDDLGKVRRVTLVEGPDSDLDQAALTAIKDFRFKPARVNEKKVAVKIRYTYRFVLDN